MPAPRPAQGLEVLPHYPEKGEKFPFPWGAAVAPMGLHGAVPPKLAVQLQAPKLGPPRSGIKVRIWPKCGILYHPSPNCPTHSPPSLCPMPPIPSPSYAFLCPPRVPVLKFPWAPRLWRWTVHLSSVSHVPQKWRKCTLWSVCNIWRLAQAAHAGLECSMDCALGCLDCHLLTPSMTLYVIIQYCHSSRVIVGSLGCPESLIKHTWTRYDNYSLNFFTELDQPLYFVIQIAPPHSFCNSSMLFQFKL